MHFTFGPRIRHPFFPGLHATPAAEAKLSNPALYGTYQELLRAAEDGASVRRAVFVTQMEGQPLLSDSEREVLWRRFQVPAFVLLLDGRQQVMAYECEAQSGLHLSLPHPVESNEEPLCECGRPGKKMHTAV